MRREFLFESNCCHIANIFIDLDLRPTILVEQIALILLQSRKENLFTKCTANIFSVV